MTEAGVLYNADCITASPPIRSSSHVLRQRFEDLIEHLISILDCADGDPDIEPGCDLEATNEDAVDAKPARIRACGRAVCI